MKASSILLCALVVVCIVSSVEALQSPCSYCQYCTFCEQCSQCPCDESKNSNCKMCKYCPYCKLCEACSMCTEGGLIDQVTGYLSTITSTLGFSPDDVNEAELQADLKSVNFGKSKRPPKTTPRKTEL